MFVVVSSSSFKPILQVAQTEEIANDFQSTEAVAEVASIPQSIGTKRFGTLTLAAITVELLIGINAIAMLYLVGAGIRLYFSLQIYIFT